MKIWYDGEMVEGDDARISIFDHGVLYGDGCFEGMRFYGGKIFKLEAHMKRLFNCMRYLMLDLPWSIEEVTQATIDTVAQCGLEDGYIRLVVTRGVGDLGLDPANCPRPSMIIIAQDIALYPAEMYEQGLNVITSSYRRSTPDVLCPQVKSLNYLGSIMAKIECVQRGAGEALFLNALGNVAECTGDNIFIVKDGEILTPPVTEGALDGITRQAVFEICAQLGITIREKVMNRFDIIIADECFLTGSAAEVIAVSSLDERPIGSGKQCPITKRVLAAFQEMVRL